MQQMTFRQMDKIIRANGYERDRVNGSHVVYKHRETGRIIWIAKKKEINMCIARRLIKEYDLKIK